MIVDCIRIRHSITHSTRNWYVECIRESDRSSGLKYHLCIDNKWDAYSLDQFIQQKINEPSENESWFHESDSSGFASDYSFDHWWYTDFMFVVFHPGMSFVR